MTCSVASSLTDEILSPDDMVGEGIQLQGEDVRLLSMHPTAQLEPPVLESEVIKRAIICLVRKVLSRSSLEGIDSTPVVHPSNTAAILRLSAFQKQISTQGLWLRKSLR